MCIPVRVVLFNGTLFLFKSGQVQTAARSPFQNLQTGSAAQDQLTGDRADPTSLKDIGVTNQMQLQIDLDLSRPESALCGL